jgi:cob(I)alamin adenosyltransferase
MGIYTRGGDGGETSLFGGGRVGKSAPRIACYGDIDELNSVLGWCASAADGPDVAVLQHVQALLFTLGSQLATPPDAPDPARAMLPQFPSAAVEQLEQQIDAWEARTGALATFILPGGCELAARLHVARSVCRRAERRLAAFAEDAATAVDAQHLAFLNRLSDWLFAFARATNHADGTADVPWAAPE